ncbi:hypothetical protein BJY54_005738 [Streptomyces nodosus]|nr:hypothetical protein [Streptomyces nodosus]
MWTRKQAGYGDRQGVSLAQGYILDVYGPDGTRLRHYDTAPE